MSDSSALTPLVSIIVPVFNLWDYTFRCLLSIQQHTSHIPHEVIVVDDVSTDETREGLPLLQGLRVIRNEVNEGFAKNNNKAAAVALGKYLLFLNNDTEVHEGWLDEMLKVANSDSKIGMVGSKLLFSDGTIQHAGIGFSYGAPEPISPFHIHYKQPANQSNESCDLNGVTAACALISKELFTSLGGFDAGFRMGYEDVDLCLRVRTAGYRIVYTPLSVVTHFESLSAGRFVASRRNLELLHHKWLGRMNAFESDYRKVSRPVLFDPSRAGCSIVVAIHDQLSLVAPCLENVWHTLGPQDELVIVDDGSVGATSQYLRLFKRDHPGRTTLIRHEVREGLSQAWRIGLSAATKPYACTVVCALRVLERWIDRCVRHLEANPNVGVLCGRQADSYGLRSEFLLAPFAPTEEGLSLPPPQRAGNVEITAFLASGMIAAQRERLVQLIDLAPQGVPGGHPQAWQRALHVQGLNLAVATDVTVYPLNQVFPSSGPQSLDAYHRNIANVLDAGPLEKPLCSVVVVARDFPAELQKCLRALCSHTMGRWELIVVDDGSKLSLARDVQAVLDEGGLTPPLTQAFLRQEQSLGWPAAINHGLSVATGEVVVVMNGDVVVTPLCFVRMNALLDVNDRIAAVAPVCNVGPQPQCCDQPNFTQPPMPFDEFSIQRTPDVLNSFGSVPRVAGLCLAIKRTALTAIGGFDPRYGDADGDVEDFCLRLARCGFLVAIAAEAYVEHLGRSSQRWLDLHPRRAAPEGWLRFCARWGYPIECSDTDGLSRIFTAEPPFNKTTDFVKIAP